MGLFKIFRGIKEELPPDCQEGYAYFATDTGELFIDIISTTSTVPGTRIQVNAGSATKLSKEISNGTIKTVEIEDIALKNEIESKVWNVAHGGTGRTTLTLNAVMVGNGTNSIKLIPSKNGALYATSTNGEPQFGVLPVAQGGTGNTTGNSPTATKFASAQSITLTGDVTGSASSQAGWNISTALVNSGVTSGNYGPFLNGLCWMANNGGQKSTTATWTLTAKRAGTLRFLYACGGEESYDYLTVTAKGTEIVNTKGKKSPHGGYVEATLAVNDVVIFSHIEDSSNFYNNDYAGIGNLSLGAANSDFKTITPDNINTYFTVSNGTYTFAPMMVFTGASEKIDAKGRIIEAENVFPTIYTLDEWKALTGGGNGGNADTATKLATARTIQTNLASTSAASFDGTANITPGIMGTLSIAHGGTGATSASTALSNLGGVPTSRTINGKALTNDITISADIPYLKGSGIANANISGNCIALGNQANALQSETISIGTNTRAEGNFSVAIGANTIVSSANTVVLGHSIEVNGIGSTCIGHQASAEERSVAIGHYASAARYGIAIGGGQQSPGVYGDKGAFSGGVYGIAVGFNSHCSVQCIALGCEAETGSDYSSIAIGFNANISKNAWEDYTQSCIAIGTGATIRGNGKQASESIVIGSDTYANNYGCTALGQMAKVYGQGSTALGSRASTSNNYSIQLGDAVSLSSITARVAITVTSDERDKTDIIEIGNGAIEFLNKLKAVTFVYNQRELYRPKDPEKDKEGNPIIEENVDYLTEEDHENIAKYGYCRYDKEAHKAGALKGTRRRVGLLAQEIQKALAEVYGSADYANIVNDNLHDLENVPEGIESTLAMNYEALIPFLIKGFQEQEEEIQNLKVRIIELEKKI